MDVWVNFTHATKWQAEGIFKCFFPSKPAPSSTVTTSQEKDDVSQKNMPVPKRKAPGHAIPVLEEAEIAELAKRFADAIPEGELSVSHPSFRILCSVPLTPPSKVAALQGYLLKNKVRPRECVDEVGDWLVVSENARTSGADGLPGSSRNVRHAKSSRGKRQRYVRELRVSEDDG